MDFNFPVKVLAGAIALAIGGTAMATSLDATSTGDVFINIVDTSNNSSFLYDTGVSQASFNAGGNYSYNLASDPNYQQFVAAEGGTDVLDYSVASATKTTTTPNAITVLFTSNNGPLAVPGSNMAQAQTAISGFFTVANGTASSTTNSALLTSASGNTWGQAGYEQALDTALGIVFTAPGSGVDALVGTALNFYDESSNALRSSQTPSTLTTLAGKWDVVNGVATYTAQTQTVPLPTPVLLLLSGLGLMGVVARRGKGAASV